MFCFVLSGEGRHVYHLQIKGKPLKTILCELDINHVKFIDHCSPLQVWVCFLDNLDDVHIVFCLHDVLDQTNYQGGQGFELADLGEWYAYRALQTM